MDENITIRKAANALLALFISASPIASAMDQPEAKLSSHAGRLRDHSYYKAELQKLEESTRRIHEEVDRILVEFRKNMEEYRKHTGGTGTIQTLDQQQKAREEAEQKVAREAARVKAEEKVRKREEREKAEKSAAEEAEREAARVKAEKEAARVKAEKEAKEREEQRKAEEAHKLAEKNASSELVRGHSYYQRELEKLAESTRRIHEEVDRILAEFRKNMEEYYRHTKRVWMKTITTPETVGKEGAGQEESETAQNQAEGQITIKPVANMRQEKSTLPPSRSRPQASRLVAVRGDTPVPKMQLKNSSEKVKEVTSMLTKLDHWGLTRDQLNELEALILEKLNEFSKNPITLNDSRDKLINALNKKYNFYDAKAVLKSDVKSPKVLLKTGFLDEEEVKKRDYNIQTGKMATISHMYQDQINKDTTRVLEESGIQGWITKLSETDRKAIESGIKRIVTKLYDKSVPTLTGGASPLQPFIKAFKKVKTLKDFEKEITKFEQDGEKFREFVVRGKESEKSTVDMEAIASTVPMEFRPMISKQKSSLINIDAWEASSLLKFKDGKNLAEAVEFEEIKKSSGTGFVVVPVGSETSDQQINMKVFSLGITERFSLTVPQKGKTKPNKNITNPQPFQEVQYYKVTSTSSAQELQDLKDRLSKGKYELWALPGDVRSKLFFAISLDPSQMAISFSLNQGDPRLQGTVYNHIAMAKFLMSGQTGPFQGGVVGAIKAINSKK